MIHPPYPFRCPDDDSGAPVDYSYVSSVSEGRRRAQQKNIHDEDEQAAPRPLIRHRADPYDRERVDAYGTRAPMRRPDRSGTVQMLPTPEEEAIPENPYDRPAARRRSQPQQEAQPQVIVTEDGSQFDLPAMAKLPEWYRVAQQNASTTDDRMRRAPKVQAAPRVEMPEEEELPVQYDPLGRPIARRTEPRQERRFQGAADRYAEAGYPPELLQEQRELDEKQEVISRRRRHGAQQAVSERRQEEYRRSLSGEPGSDRRSYPPSREEYAYRRQLTEEERQRRARAAEEALARQQEGAQTRGQAYRQAVQPWGAPEESRENPYAAPYPAREEPRRAPTRLEEPEEERAPRFRIPWLGIAVFVMAGLAVGLWLMQLNFQAQTRQVVQERAQARITIREKHPLEYRELIEREARKNNLHPAFVEAIVFNESTFRTGAESSVGARGLMQVMEDTAADIAKALKVENYSFDQLYDAETNVTFGCYYLGKLSQRFRGDPLLVAMAYHAGGNQVQNWLNTSLYSTDGLTIVLDNLPDGPTKQYAIRVKRDFAIYRRLYYDALEDDA